VRVQQMQNTDGHAIEVAAGNPVQVWIPVEGPAEGALIARML
jgi:putative protease